jgi:hypothetical protein
MHFGMPFFNEVVIDLKCVNLSQGIMFIWSKQHQLRWMWLWNVSFWMCARCYLLVCCCSKFKIVKHGRITCIIVHHIIFLLWMAKMNHSWWLSLHDFLVCCVNKLRELLLCWFVINVLEVGIWDVSRCHWKNC